MLYEPSTVRFEADGVPVSVTEETDYPFGETVRFVVRLEGGQRARFPFPPRVPGLCDSPTV